MGSSYFCYEYDLIVWQGGIASTGTVWCITRVSHWYRVLKKSLNYHCLTHVTEFIFLIISIERFCQITSGVILTGSFALCSQRRWEGAGLAWPAKDINDVIDEPSLEQGYNAFSSFILGDFEVDQAEKYGRIKAFFFLWKQRSNS